MRVVVVPILACAAFLACENLDGLSGGKGDANETIADGGKRNRDSGSEVGSPILSPDASPTGKQRCDPSKPFGEPTLVQAFDAGSTTRGAVMSTDELEAFYILDDGGSQLRHARRASLDAAWTVVTEPVDPPPELSLSLTTSGLHLYYWTLVGTSPSQPRVMLLSRTTREATFDAPHFFNVPGDQPAYVAEQDDSAYFPRVTNDGGLDEPIFHAASNGNGLIGEQVLQYGHVFGAFDQKPVVNASETVLYYSSNRDPSLGADDIWVAKRPSKSVPFTDSQRVDELSTAANDWPSWISPDDCVILIERAKHIFMAQRPL